MLKLTKNTAFVDKSLLFWPRFLKYLSSVKILEMRIVMIRIFGRKNGLFRERTDVGQMVEVVVVIMTVIVLFMVVFVSMVMIVFRVYKESGVIQPNLLTICHI